VRFTVFPICPVGAHGSSRLDSDARSHGCPAGPDGMNGG